MTAWPTLTRLDPAVESFLITSSYRATVAEHPLLSPQAQLALLKRAEPRVRRSLADNAGLIPEVQAELLAHPSDPILSALARNPALTPAHQLVLTRGGVGTVLDLASNPSLTPAARSALLSGHVLARTAALEAAALEEDLEAQLLEDPSTWRSLVERDALRPRSVEVLLEYALSDDGAASRVQFLDFLGAHLTREQSAALLEHPLLPTLDLLASGHLDDATFERVFSSSKSARLALARSSHLTESQQRVLARDASLLTELCCNEHLSVGVRRDLLDAIDALPAGLPPTAGPGLRGDLLRWGPDPFEIFKACPLDASRDDYASALLENEVGGVHDELPAGPVLRIAPVELFAHAHAAGLDVEDLAALAPGFTGTVGELLDVTAELSAQP